MFKKRINGLMLSGQWLKQIKSKQISIEYKMILYYNPYNNYIYIYITFRPILVKGHQSLFQKNYANIVLNVSQNLTLSIENIIASKIK